MGNRLYETIYMTAASILYSCLWYDSVELYVDPIGFEYLEGLPCQITKVNFDNNTELWMKPKIYAIQNQNEPFVHLDTDVFLRKPILWDFKKVIVERMDMGYHNYKDLITFFDPFCQQFDFWNPNLKHVWSCGIIGFKDLGLRDKFMDCFSILEDIFITNKNAFQEFKNNCSGSGWYLEPGLLLEQYNLASLLFQKGIKPEVLILGKLHQEQSAYANEIGYVHLFGASKYHPKNVNKIKELLRKDFHHYYSMITKKVKLNEVAIV